MAARQAKIEKLLTTLFRKRWQAVVADFANRVDVAKARAWFMLANDARASVRLAQRYYTPERAAKFATASTSEVVDLCWAWFVPFKVYVHMNEPEWSEIEEQLENLVAAEYVAVTWQLLESRPPYPEWGWDLSEPDVLEEIDCYACPDLWPLVPDGFVYEGIVAEEFGHYLRVAKSVAEPFRKAERAHAMDAIERELLVEGAAQDEDPRALSINFLPPEGLGMLIEADILCNLKSKDQREMHRELLKLLKVNGTGYVKRPRPYQVIREINRSCNMSVLERVQQRQKA